MSENHKGNVNAVKLTTPPHRGIGLAPDYFCQDRKGIWDELVTNVQPELWGSNDRPSLENYVNLLFKYRTTPDKFSSQEGNLKHKYETSLGLSPMARSKIKQAKSDKPESKQKKNKFSEM